MIIPVKVAKRQQQYVYHAILLINEKWHLQEINVYAIKDILIICKLVIAKVNKYINHSLVCDYSCLSCESSSKKCLSCDSNS